MDNERMKEFFGKRAVYTFFFAILCRPWLAIILFLVRVLFSTLADD